MLLSQSFLAEQWSVCRSQNSIMLQFTVCICFFSSGVDGDLFVDVSVMCSWEGKTLAKAQGLVSELAIKCESVWRGLSGNILTDSVRPMWQEKMLKKTTPRVILWDTTTWCACWGRMLQDSLLASGSGFWRRAHAHTPVTCCTLMIMIFALMKAPFMLPSGINSVS